MADASHVASSDQWAMSESDTHHFWTEILKSQFTTLQLCLVLPKALSGCRAASISESRPGREML